MKKVSIESMLSDAQLTIEGALKHPDVLQKLSRFGYDQKRIKEGKVLYEKAVMMYEIQQQGYREKQDATSDMQQGRRELEALYNRHYRIARAVLDRREVYWKAMQLSGTRRRSYAGWLKQVKDFYRHVDMVKGVMAKHGVGREEVERATAMLEAMAEARVRQNHHKSDAQRATQVRNKAFTELVDWLGDFRKIAKIAFKKDYQLLEAIGMVVPLSV